MLSKAIPLIFIWICVAVFVVASIIAVESYFALGALIAFPLLVGLALSRERSISISIRTMELTIAVRLFFNCICWKRVFKLDENGEFMIAKARNEDRDRVLDVFFRMSVDRKIFLLRLEENEKECAERFSESLNHIAYGETVSIIG